MSGRDRDRERERASRAQQQAQQRTNEYFVPKEGIDREVITADICRYLGNDALVRPGNYENPQTRQVQQGYFITAYRNLTTAMIADLKADSERWEAERRQTASRGQPSNVEYRASTTHQSRQYYGPTEAAQGTLPGYPAAPATSVQQQGVYDTGSQYQTGYAQPATGYASTQGYAVQDNYFVAGADYRSDPSSTRVSSTQQGTIPRTGTVQYASTPTYQQQPDSRNTYYSSQPGTQVSSSAQYPTQHPSDPFYGRGAYNHQKSLSLISRKGKLSNSLAAPTTATGYGDTTPEVYDSRAYPDTSAYTQATIPQSSTVTASQSSRRDRDREDRDRHGHRSRR